MCEFIDSTAVNVEGRRLIAESTNVFEMYGGTAIIKTRKHIVDVVRQLKGLGHHITNSAAVAVLLSKL